MQLTKKTVVSGLLLVLLLVVGLTAALANTASSPVSNGGVMPYIIAGANPGGNRTCAEVGTAFFGNANYYQFSSERVNYDNGAFDKAFPAGLNVNTDGTFVTFNSTFGIGAVIVKGSADANVYVYEPQVKTDSGLASPINPSGRPSGLSNLTFCWNPEPEDCEWIGETAWAAGNRYTARGNWATFTPYSGVAKTVTLFAGQTRNAGNVHFSAPAAGKVTITITLNDGWRFAAVNQNVKVQDYAAAPSGNPAPGLFAHKGTAAGSPFQIVVPQNNFYGVHADVEWKKCS